MTTRKKAKQPTPTYSNAPKLTPAQRATIVARVASGESQRELAREFGVARGTIAKLVRPKRSTAEPAWAGLVLDGKFAPPNEAEPAAEVEVDPNRRAIDALRSTLATAEAEAKVARAAGNSTLAQRYSRDVANIGIALGRLEKLEAEKDPDAFSFSKEEYQATEGKIETTLRLLLQGHGLRCVDCHRALAIEWGKSDLTRESEGQ